MWHEFPVPSLADWRQRVDADLKGADFEQTLPWSTYDGLRREPIYTAGDIQGLQHLGGRPGEPPFVRGSRTDNEWLLSQRFTLANPKQTRAQLRAAEGLEQVELELDPGTSLGRLRESLEGIRLENFRWSLCPEGSGLAALALFQMVYRPGGQGPGELSLGLDFDPLGLSLTRGELAPGDLLSEVPQLLGQDAQFSDFHCLTVSGVPYHEAGADAVQELGYAMATGAYYLRELLSQGLELERLLPCLSLKLSISSDLFTDVAKVRAARLLWSKIAHAFGARERRQLAIRVHLQSSQRDLTMLDHHSNLIRSAVHGFAGIVAGCDALSLCPSDRPLDGQELDALRLARNQQFLLRDESRLDHVVDPAGGSYYIESLTDAVGRASWALMQQIESEGGMLACLRAGGPQNQVRQTAERRADDLRHDRHFSLVGTTRYATLESPSPRPGKPGSQCTGVRQADNFEQALTRIAEGATLGELTPVTEQVLPGLPPWRGAEPFEELCRRGEKAEVEALLLPVGERKVGGARARFAAGMLGIANLSSQEGPACDSLDQAVQAARESESRLLVLCGPDEVNAELIPLLRQALGDTRLLAVAGQAVDGADFAFNRTSDRLAVLGDLVDRLTQAEVTA